MKEVKEKALSYLRTIRYADVILSLWCASSFVGLGTSLTVFSQTLFDQANYLSIETSNLAPMFSVRAFGHSIGSVTSGVLFDRFYYLSFWQLIVVITIGSIANIILPLSVHLAMVGVIMFLEGIILGALDNGVHAVVMRIWKHKSGPVMQLIHFAFALGAFLAPLIAKPFLTEEISYTNISCSELMNMYESSTHNISRCVAMVIENCSNISSMVDGSADILTNVHCRPEPSLYFAWAFWITTIPLFIPLPAFIFYAYRDQCFCKVASKTANNGVDEKTNTDHDKTSETHLYPDTIPYKIFLFSFLATIMLVYVGMEVTYGNFIFAYSVNSELRFSKQQAALITAVFWGSFTFFRFFAFPLTLCRVPSWVLLSINVGGGLLGSIVLVIWPVTPTAVWIASSILGCSMASIFPNVMVWLSEHGPSSGKATGLLIVGATIGDVSLPTIVGILVTMSSTMALPYFTLSAMLLCTVLLTVLFVVSKLWTNHYLRTKREDSSKYNRLQFTDEEEEEREEIELQCDDNGDPSIENESFVMLNNSDSTVL